MIAQCYCFSRQVVSTKLGSSADLQISFHKNEINPNCNTPTHNSMLHGVVSACHYAYAQKMWMLSVIYSFIISSCYTCNLSRKASQGEVMDGQTAQQCRAHSTLAEDLVHFLAPTTGGLQLSVRPAPGDPMPSSSSGRLLDSHTYAHIQTNTCTRN